MIKCKNDACEGMVVIKDDNIICLKCNTMYTLEIDKRKFIEQAFRFISTKKLTVYDIRENLYNNKVIGIEEIKGD